MMLINVSILSSASKQLTLKFRGPLSSVFLILSLLACSGHQKGKEYSDIKGRFAINFKGSPTIKTENQNLQFGNITWFITETKNVDTINIGYLVKYADLPPNIITSDSLSSLQDFFEILQNDLAIPLGETAFDDINIKEIQKYPGREFKWIDKRNNLGITRRIFIVKNRLYFLEVSYRLQNDFNNAIELYLNSFKLLDTEANKNPEIVPEKPLKKFIISFPGRPKRKDNLTFSNLFGNIHAVIEAYEVPPEQMQLSSNVNILYGVNYVKLPFDKLKIVSENEIKDFVTRAFTDNIKNANGKILLLKEKDFNGYWGIEGLGTIINGTIILHANAFVVRDYYYQIIVLTKKGYEENQQALYFINSFRLISE